MVPLVKGRGLLCEPVSLIQAAIILEAASFLGPGAMWESAVFFCHLGDGNASVTWVANLHFWARPGKKGLQPGRGLAGDRASHLEKKTGPVLAFPGS